ncbi:MAG: hypothetical protein CL395_08375 [Acidiferrobacteraceae bacterium]|jgi:hypothetical protein|nr:hypothetical protein [Acidiferrobacteraceae bacterium]|tara:strand:- start:20 stop:637 length:618 start_codon:yes stop_codon:yes gene_type:complete
MSGMAESHSLYNCTSVKDYFRQQVANAIEEESVSVMDETRAYIVNLLDFYSRTDHFFEHTADGLELRPLAIVYGEALAAKTGAERVAGLRRVGDVALFVAGVFRHSFSRKPIGVDYYIAMGGNAYEHLSLACTRAGKGAGVVFQELGTKFALLAEVLSRSFEPGVENDKNLLALYERWRQTGSSRCARQLRQAGINLGTSSAQVH